MKKLILLAVIVISSNACTDAYRNAKRYTIIEIKNNTNSTVSIVTNLGIDDSLAVNDDLSKTYNGGDVYTHDFGLQRPSFIGLTENSYIQLKYNGKMKIDKVYSSVLDTINILENRDYRSNSSNKKNKNKHPDTEIITYTITQADINEAK